MFAELRVDYKTPTKVLPKYSKCYIVGVVKKETEPDWKYLLRFEKEEFFVNKEDINIL